ncbi:VanZ family protein [Lentibacillus sediminis]|uniref:VanZ family protein n=1 Tax=Lentibacillus sediminis TaxID=1940529 RepID=UPI000C1BB8B5|nr:VanZ family protein [Lentibacillus sediminis]
MKYFLLTLWAVFIFISTCTENVFAFFRDWKISFDFNPNPTWDTFLQLYPLAQASMLELIGHFIMFLILTFLLMGVFHEIGHVFILAVTYAFLTEVLQVYFGRGGDLYDIAANVLGIGVGLVVGSYLQKVYVTS